MHIETQEIRQWLVMWRELKQLYEAEQHEVAVVQFGSIFVSHNEPTVVSREILRLEALIRERERNGITSS